MKINCKYSKFIILSTLFFYVANGFAGTCDTILNTEKLNQCLDDELLLADKELNDIYRQFRRDLTGVDSALLKKAQTSWVAYRDRDCEFEASSVAAGTAYQSVYISCQTERTKQRSKQLKEWGRLFKGSGTGK